MLGEYVLQQLNELRHHRINCDLELVSSDKKVFPLHQIVFMAVNRDHFNIAVRNAKIGVYDILAKKKMMLSSLTSVELQLLVDFMYGQTANKTGQNSLKLALKKVHMEYLLEKAGRDTDSALPQPVCSTNNIQPAQAAVTIKQEPISFDYNEETTPSHGMVTRNDELCCESVGEKDKSSADLVQDEVLDSLRISEDNNSEILEKDGSSNESPVAEPNIAEDKSVDYIVEINQYYSGKDENSDKKEKGSNVKKVLEIKKEQAYPDLDSVSQQNSLLLSQNVVNVKEENDTWYKVPTTYGTLSHLPVSQSETSSISLGNDKVTGTSDSEPFEERSRIKECSIVADTQKKDVSSPADMVIKISAASTSVGDIIQSTCCPPLNSEGKLLSPSSICERKNVEKVLVENLWKNFAAIRQKKRRTQSTVEGTSAKTFDISSALLPNMKPILPKPAVSSNLQVMPNTNYGLVLPASAVLPENSLNNSSAKSYRVINVSFSTAGAASSATGLCQSSLPSSILLTTATAVENDSRNRNKRKYTFKNRKRRIKTPAKRARRSLKSSQQVVFGIFDLPTNMGNSKSSAVTEMNPLQDSESFLTQEDSADDIPLIKLKQSLSTVVDTPVNCRKHNRPNGVLEKICVHEQSHKGDDRSVKSETLDSGIQVNNKCAKNRKRFLSDGSLELGSLTRNNVATKETESVKAPEICRHLNQKLHSFHVKPLDFGVNACEVDENGSEQEQVCSGTKPKNTGKVLTALHERGGMAAAKRRKCLHSKTIVPRLSRIRKRNRKHPPANSTVNQGPDLFTEIVSSSTVSSDKPVLQGKGVESKAMVSSPSVLLSILSAPPKNSLNSSSVVMSKDFASPVTTRIVPTFSAVKNILSTSSPSLVMSKDLESAVTSMAVSSIETIKNIGSIVTTSQSPVSDRVCKSVDMLKSSVPRQSPGNLLAERMFRKILPKPSSSVSSCPGTVQETTKMPTVPAKKATKKTKLSNIH